MPDRIRRLIHGAKADQRLRDAGVVVLLLLTAVFVFRTDLIEGNIFYEADTRTYYYPVMSALDRAIDRSSIPLWTPHIFGGYPLFADGEGGMLYLPNMLLLWLFPAQYAFLLLRVLSYFLASVFTYAYCRALSVGRHGGLVAALTFAYGSFMVGQMQHPNLSSGAIWLPLVLLFVEVALRRSGRKRCFYLVLAGVAVAMQSLAVHIQPLLLTLLALSLYVVFRTVVWRLVDVWRQRDGLWCLLAPLGVIKRACGHTSVALLSVGAVVAVGLGLGAVQLIPLYELGQTAVRGTSSSYWFATLYALPIPNLVTLVFPYFFVGPEDYGWSLWPHWESTVYVGIASLMLAAAGLAFVRHRIVLFFAFLGALSLYLAFGDYPPVKLYWLLWQLPGFHFLRAPGRFTFLFVFSVAILAAMGLDWLVRTLNNPKARLERCLAVKVSLFIAATVVLSAAILFGQFVLREMLLEDKSSSLAFIQSRYLTMRNWNTGLSAEGVYRSLLYSLDIANPRTLRAFLFLFGSPALMLLWLRFRRFTSVWVSLLVAVVLVDLATFATEFHPRLALSGLSTPSGVVKYLVENSGGYRVYNRGYVNATEPNRLMAWGVSMVGGYSSLSPSRNGDFNAAIERGSLRLLDLWNVRYVVSQGGGGLLPEYRVVYQQDDVAIYENPHPLPRAFLVPSVLVVPSRQAALDVIRDGTFDPTRLVVLEEAFDASLLTDSPTIGEKSVASSLGDVQVAQYARELVRLKTFAADNSFLVLSDSYYPGWKAYVDGREAKIYRADYLFRGVFLPAGSHDVVFSFEPASFYLGRNISIAALLLAALAIVYSLAPWRLRLSPKKLAPGILRPLPGCTSADARVVFREQRLLHLEQSRE